MQFNINSSLLRRHYRLVAVLRLRRRSHSPFSIGVLVLVALSLFCALWAIGSLDYLRQTSFQYFHWPSVDIDRMDLPLFNPWAANRPVIKPSCAREHMLRDHDDKFVLVVVRNAPQRKERRGAIRASWALNSQLSGFHFRTVFVMGARTLERDFLAEEETELRAEANQFGDLLVGDFVDHYNNCTLKLIHAIGLARRYCGAARPVPFLLLIDDDEIMLPWNLAAELERHSADEERLYQGWLRRHSWPARLVFSKWQIGIDAYPFDEYPDYVNGNAMLLSGQSVADFHAAIPYTKAFIWDDVWLGMMAHYLGIEPSDNPNFVGNQTLSIADSNWDGVVAAHGFGAEDIHDIYAQLAERWRTEERRKLQKSGARGNREMRRKRRN